MLTMFLFLLCERANLTLISGFCLRQSICLEHSFPRSLHVSFSQVTQTSAQISSLQRSLLWLLYLKYSTSSIPPPSHLLYLCRGRIQDLRSGQSIIIRGRKAEGIAIDETSLVNFVKEDCLLLFNSFSHVSQKVIHQLIVKVDRDSEVWKEKGRREPSIL